MRLAGGRLDGECRAWRARCARGACRASTATSCSAGRPWHSPEARASRAARAGSAVGARAARKAADCSSRPWATHEPGGRAQAGRLPRFERRQRGERVAPRRAWRGRRRRRLHGSGSGQTSCRGTIGRASSSSSSTSASRSSARLEGEHIVLALGIERRGGLFAIDEEDPAVDVERPLHRLQAALALQRARCVGAEMQRRLAPAPAQPAPRAVQPARRPAWRGAAASAAPRLRRQPQQTRKRPSPSSGARLGGERRTSRRFGSKCAVRWPSNQCTVAAPDRCEGDGTMSRCRRGASSSPRLRATGASCSSACACRSRCVAPEVDETPLAGETPPPWPRLALAKADAVAARATPTRS